MLYPLASPFQLAFVAFLFFLLKLADGTTSFDLNAVELHLPTTMGEMTVVSELLEDNDGDGLVPVLLPRSSSGTLVTLNRIESDIYVPVGRSYDGYEWESVAGKEENLDYHCHEPSLSHPCEVYLPIDSNNSSSYYLTVYDHAVSPRAEVARFLERTTFGPTTGEINAWDYGVSKPLGMANWVTDQIDNKGISSHRVHFRERANPRSIETYKYGISGPSACEQNSRWRTFALIRKDLKLSQYELAFNLTIEVVTNGTDVGYVLLFANHIRTVLTEPLAYYGKFANSATVDGQLNVSASYKLCDVEEIDGSVRTDPDAMNSFGLEIFSGDCRFIQGGESETEMMLLSFVSFEAQRCSMFLTHCPLIFPRFHDRKPKGQP